MKRQKRIKKAHRGGEARQMRSQTKSIPSDVIAKRYGELLALRAELQRIERRKNPD